MGSVGRADGSAGVENMGNRSGSTVAPRMFGVPRDEGVESNASPVAGGELNTANGKLASVSGGRVDTASGGRTWASGGQANIASGALLIDARKSHTLHRQPYPFVGHADRCRRFGQRCAHHRQERHSERDQWRSQQRSQRICVIDQWGR